MHKHRLDLSASKFDHGTQNAPPIPKYLIIDTLLSLILALFEIYH